MITAMDAILIMLMFLVGLFVGLAALVHFARHDAFGGPGTGHETRDELGGALSFRRRPA